MLKSALESKAVGPQVTMELTMLAKRLEEQQQLLDSLESRLTSILRPIDEKQGEAEKEIPLVPLADNIRGWRYKVEVSNGRLSDFLSRLEL